MSALQKTSSVIFSETLESYLCCKVCSIFSHHRFYLNQVFCSQFSWEYFNRFLQNCCGCCASVWTCPSAEKACPGSWDATEISVNDGQVDVWGGKQSQRREEKRSEAIRQSVGYREISSLTCQILISSFSHSSYPGISLVFLKLTGLHI